MKGWLILADAATVEGGKLFILGGGIYIAGPGPINMGVALQVMIPWESRTRRLTARIHLKDGNGQDVLVPGPRGPAPLMVQAEFEVAPSPGTPAGSEIPFAFAFNAAGLPLPGGDYAWYAFSSDEEKPFARAPFTVRAGTLPHMNPPPQQSL